MWGLVFVGVAALMAVLAWVWPRSSSPPSPEQATVQSPVPTAVDSPPVVVDSQAEGLPAPPSSAMSEAPTDPITLERLFREDFPNTMKMRRNLAFEETAVQEGP